MRNELITEILQQVLLINRKTKYAAFFKYSGHTNGLSVYIGQGKQDEQFNNWIFDWDIFLDDNSESDLQKLIETLKTYS